MSLRLVWTRRREYDSEPSGGDGPDRIVILSTHIVGDIEAACEDIAVMDEGKILFRGTVEELVDTARGKVYTAQVSRKDLPRLKQEYLVTEIRTVGNNAQVRFLSDEKPFLRQKSLRPE